MQNYRKMGWIPTLIAAAPLVFGGCGNDGKIYGHWTEGTFRGYPAVMGVDDRGVIIRLYESEDSAKSGDSPDVVLVDNDFDIRSDIIEINAKKGSPLEAYANPDSFEAAWEEFVAKDSLLEVARRNQRERTDGE